MKESFGVFLLDGAEVILRIYEVDGREWRLLHYFRQDLADNKMESKVTSRDITESILAFLDKNSSKNIADWKFCSRELADTTINDIVEATGFQIERLQRDREQELLSKGLFTELW